MDSASGDPDGPGSRRGGRQPRYSEDEWESIKDFVRSYYLEGSHTLEQLRLKLANDFDFHASPKMLKTRLDVWDMQKNLTPSRLRDNPHRFSTIKRASYRRRRATRIGEPLTPSVSPSDAEREGSATPTFMLPDSGSTYELSCPYKPLEKKFRFVEKLEGDAPFRADGLGYRDFADLDQDRPCQNTCRCHRQVLFLDEDYAFSVEKDSSRIEITIHDQALLAELHQCLQSESNFRHVPSFDGFELLRQHSDIKRHFESSVMTRPSEVVSGLRLLVNDVLCNPDVFENFDLERLRSEGYLSTGLWEFYQKQKFDKDIDCLDEAFRGIDADRCQDLGLRFDDVAKSDASLQELGNVPSTSGENSHLTPDFDHDMGDESQNIKTIPTATNSDEPHQWMMEFEDYDRPHTRRNSSGIDERIFAARNSESASAALNAIIRELPCQKPDPPTDLYFSVDYFEDYVSALQLAASRNHQSIVGVLLSAPAYVRSRALVSAVKRGCETVARLLLGREPTSTEQFSEHIWGQFDCALCFALFNDQLGVLELLLASGLCDVTIHLYRAAALHEISTIQLILRHQAHLDDLDVDFLTAVCTGDLRGMEKHLNRGANIDVLTAQGPALILADLLDEPEVFCWLVKHGADHSLAHLFKSGHEDRATFERRVRRIQKRNGSTASLQHMQTLRCSFRGQYRLLCDAAQRSHTKLNEFPKLFTTYRDAWDSALRLLRTPSKSKSVFEILALLAFTKAMTETLRQHENLDYTSDFRDNTLHCSWFTNDRVGFEVYRYAVRQVWGVHIPNYPLLRERGLDQMVTTLIKRSREYLDLDLLDSTSLGETRRRWWERKHAHAEHKPPTSHHSHPSTTTPPDPPPQPLKDPPLPPDPDIRATPPLILEEARGKTPDENVLFWATSAIFAIILIFLQILRSCVLGLMPPPALRSIASLSTPQERLAVVNVYLKTPRTVLLRWAPG